MGDEGEGFRETMRTLLGLVEQGLFPFRRDTHCNWCPYDLACRRTHPPSEERALHDGEVEAYRLLRDKNKTRKPLLSDVRGGS